MAGVLAHDDALRFAFREQVLWQSLRLERQLHHDGVAAGEGPLHLAVHLAVELSVQPLELFRLRLIEVSVLRVVAASSLSSCCARGRRGGLCLRGRLGVGHPARGREAGAGGVSRVHRRSSREDEIASRGRINVACERPVGTRYIRARVDESAPISG